MEFGLHGAIYKKTTFKRFKKSEKYLDVENLVLSEDAKY
jgi:hypothetical protein